MTQENKPTPMMEQYLSIKAQNPDAILFFRLGDFYEMFNEDALEAARILEITLTSRNKNADNPIPMCGVPYHSARDYIKRLVESGKKVAICEQMEDPRQTKGMVKREVVRIITPGTILDESALEQKENHYLAAVNVCDGVYYLAYLDLSTGQVFLTSTDDQNQLFNELLSLQVSEIVLSDQDQSNDWAVLLQERVATFYSFFGKEIVQSTPEQIWTLLDAKDAETDLLNFLFAYVADVQKQMAHHIQPVERYELSQYLQLNYYAKHQLELTKSLRTQRKKGSLLWLIDHTKTAMGGRMLHQWLDKPLLRKEPLVKRHQKVEHLMQHYFDRIDLQEALGNIYDLERLVTKISLGSANARDLDQLRYSLGQIPVINAILERINQDLLGLEDQAFDSLPEYEELWELINQRIVDEPPLSLTEGNIIRMGYDTQLDTYRDALANGHTWLSDLQLKERERTGLKTLKVGYNKVFGYYIEISRLQAQQLKDDRYIRKQTLSNNERFITEELKGIEMTILEAQEKAEKLEYDLFVDLRNQMVNYIPRLQILASQVAELDVLANFASLSEQEGYVRATISDTPKDYYLKDSRHPAIEKLIGQSAFVANDLELSPDRSLLLLTGPNMSGKSTYMRQIAFCVILNQIGCFVPAKEARLPLVDRIFTRIGASDDISSGQSTFMVEMMETNQALIQATEQSLLLFDEIGRGTATFDGMAIAEAILNFIAHKVKAATIFSTHYHELTSLEQDLTCLKNIHVGAEEFQGQVVFSHKIIAGPSDKSYGIHVAKLAGLPEAVLQNSQEILNDLEAKACQLRKKDEGQLDLFTLAEQSVSSQLTSNSEGELKEELEVIKQLKALDLNQIRPIEAMQLIDEWQKQLP
ncbi:DNA mismatch repair protein MutS [Vaginisenegalia massiliensis]|uniref:DNA mismatch repair protein MutS n=1 Tax=Vaginisenegalia massiliensis TaxID=2058294 RepID=UPI000F5236DB|nr:DNA mismatch repair protein MutS [Vaginisenegalia massiliensis]